MRIRVITVVGFSATALFTAGCVRTMDPVKDRIVMIINADHPPGFAPVGGMPDLPLGDTWVGELRITNAGGWAPWLHTIPACEAGDSKRRAFGCYAHNHITYDGRAEALGHEMRHYVDDVGEVVARPVIDALRNARGGKR